MKMHKVTRPSGRDLMVNDDMLPHLAGLGWSLADDAGENKELAQARRDYEELFGKSPHHRAGIEKILADIEERLSSGDS